jgi:hypothetical protein
MKKKRQNKYEAFDQFMETLSRMFEIPRKRIDRLMYVHTSPNTTKRSSSRQRDRQDAVTK